MFVTCSSCLFDALKLGVDTVSPCDGWVAFGCGLVKLATTVSENYLACNVIGIRDMAVIRVSEVRHDAEFYSKKQ